MQIVILLTLTTRAPSTHHWLYSGSPSANNGPTPIRSLKGKGDKGFSVNVAPALIYTCIVEFWPEGGICHTCRADLRLWDVVVTAQSSSSPVTSRLTPQFVPRICDLPEPTLAFKLNMTRCASFYQGKYVLGVESHIGQ
jgi:hypothetical protein